jgi:hypothetical protein
MWHGTCQHFGHREACDAEVFNVTKARLNSQVQNRRAGRLLKQAPIERIFEKYVGRKMFPDERVALRLEPELEPSRKLFSK